MLFRVRPNDGNTAGIRILRYYSFDDNDRRTSIWDCAFFLAINTHRDIHSLYTEGSEILSVEEEIAAQSVTHQYMKRNATPRFQLWGCEFSDYNGVVVLVD